MTAIDFWQMIYKECRSFGYSPYISASHANAIILDLPYKMFEDDNNSKEKEKEDEF